MGGMLSDIGPMTPDRGGGPIGPRPMGPGPIGSPPTGPAPTGPVPTGPGPTGTGPMGPLPTGAGPVGCADAALDTAMLVANTTAHTKQLSLRMSNPVFPLRAVRPRVP